MDHVNLLCNELPFAVLSDEHFINFLNSQSFPCINLSHEEYNPLISDDSIYNNDLNVNNSYIRNRSIDAPKSNYTFIDDFSSFNKNSLTILSLNIRSIPKNLQYFKDTIMQNSNLNINVIGFTEIRLNPSLSSLYELPGYHMFTNSRNVHGGGVSLYVARDYESTVVKDFTISDNSIETIGVQATVGTRKSIFLCVYRPPSGIFTTFQQVINDILSSVYEQNFEAIYVFGDFNLNLFKCNDNNVSDYVNLMYSFSLFPFITKPTRITSTSATLIDHMWSTQLEENVGNFIIQTDVSDHFPILSQFKTHNVQEPQIIWKRYVTAFSMGEFAKDLSLINCYNILSLDCCEEGFELFYNEFYKLFLKHFPIKKGNFK